MTAMEGLISGDIKSFGIIYDVSNRAPCMLGVIDEP